jgi:serine/threonine kinase 38
MAYLFLKHAFDLFTPQSHTWFKGTEWDRLYQVEAAFKPEVKDELDTQNFEKFEEVRNGCKSVTWFLC